MGIASHRWRDPPADRGKRSFSYQSRPTQGTLLKSLPPFLPSTYSTRQGFPPLIPSYFGSREPSRAWESLPVVVTALPPFGSSLVLLSARYPPPLTISHSIPVPGPSLDVSDASRLSGSPAICPGSLGELDGRSNIFGAFFALIFLLNQTMHQNHPSPQVSARVLLWIPQNHRIPPPIAILAIPSFPYQHAFALALKTPSSWRVRPSVCTPLVLCGTDIIPSPGCPVSAMIGRTAIIQASRSLSSVFSAFYLRLPVDDTNPIHFTEFQPGNRLQSRSVH